MLQVWKANFKEPTSIELLSNNALSSIKFQTNFQVAINKALQSIEQINNSDEDDLFSKLSAASRNSWKL